MVLARAAEPFSPGTHSSQASPDTLPTRQQQTGHDGSAMDSGIPPRAGVLPEAAGGDEAELEEPRAPYQWAMLAGGIGGLTGDMLMHSLDTVKTRQQGDPHRPPKYHSLGNTYWTILRQEGVARGLYGGVTPAAIGSFVGTSVFFGSYEWSKRLMIDAGMAPSLAYLNAGLVADLAASPLYVPTEVLKTRLQLQGRYNNPHFKSGYNYRSTWNAVRTMVRSEGVAALFFGYRATLYRDLPFSALQFTFYEEERNLAKRFVGSRDIGLPLEILTAATAGGLAGTMTTPLDVVKTRIQTQVNPSPQQSPAAPIKQQTRSISTSSPSTTVPRPGSVTLDTSSVITGLRLIYRSEGIAGWFRGVGPRGVWTSVQSGTMLVLYQALLKRLSGDAEGDEA